MNFSQINPEDSAELKKFFYDFTGAFAVTEKINLSIKDAGDIVEKIAEKMSLYDEEEGEEVFLNENFLWKKKMGGEAGYAVLDKTQDEGDYFMTVTFLSELTDSQPVSNCSKIIITKKTSEHELQEKPFDVFIPFAEIFAFFFNTWSAEKINIFPYVPDKPFFDYDFEMFDFTLVKFVSPVKISEMQEFYASDYLLLSGEYKAKNSEGEKSREDFIDISKLLNGRHKAEINLAELSKMAKKDPEKILKALVSNAESFIRTGSGEKTYCGSQSVLVITKNTVTVYSPEYFLRDAR
ncbi:hypothetical protein JW890_01470 [candidate division WOR-3 bacterium]|nr:hypothetical protein [candidate division WOR-3 bacterium]